MMNILEKHRACVEEGRDRGLTRHVVLPTLPGLVQSPQSTRRLISEGFHAVESIAGLTQSRINIGWTNTPNLGKVLSKATSKGLKQRK
jgi:hypothetical protein